MEDYSRVQVYGTQTNITLSAFKLPCLTTKEQGRLKHKLFADICDINGIEKKNNTNKGSGNVDRDLAPHLLIRL